MVLLFCQLKVTRQRGTESQTKGLGTDISGAAPTDHRVVGKATLQVKEDPRAPITAKS